ncbi:MAG: hypothetical protein ACREOO_27355 [bacterium]
MRNKILLCELGLLLVFVLGCNKQQPTQMKDNVSLETNFSKWLGEGQRFDKDGNLRVPTFLVRNHNDTTLLSFENWGIAKRSLAKTSDYTWDYTVGIYNLNEGVEGGSNDVCLYCTKVLAWLL